MSRRVYFAFFGAFLSLIFTFGIGNNTAKALTVLPKVELDGDPGSTVKSNIKIINEERQTKTYYLRYENFNAEDETGNPTFSSRPGDLASWIHTPDSITLGPGENYNLPVEIDVPANADPGGHYAALFFLSQPPGGTNNDGDVALVEKLGTLLLFRVNGDFVQNANILEFSTIGKQKFYSQLPVGFYYRFQNTGDDHQKPVGDIDIKNIIGSSVKNLSANPVDGSALPKSVRKFTSIWTESGGDFKQPPVIDLPKADKMQFWDAVNYQARHFVFGRYTATLKVGFGVKEFKTDRATFVFYVIPWQLLIVIIPALIILLIILRWILKRYNRYIVNSAQRRNS